MALIDEWRSPFTREDSFEHGSQNVREKYYATTIISGFLRPAVSCRRMWAGDSRRKIALADNGDVAICIRVVRRQF